VSTIALPIVCAWCERVRTSADGWQEADVDPNADTATHGICPDCLVAQTREAEAAATCR
jgi:hypothetical protein